MKPTDLKGRILNDFKYDYEDIKFDQWRIHLVPRVERWLNRAVDARLRVQHYGRALAGALRVVAVGVAGAMKYVITGRR